jgi:hypothetical protein
MAKTKPKIVVHSKPTDDVFEWSSNGWNDAHRARTKTAQKLMTKAVTAIEEAHDATDAIAKLRQAGFDVEQLN